MSPSTQNDLEALNRFINQADLVLATIPDPHASVASARESLTAAITLSTDIVTRLAQSRTPQTPAEMGSKGGNTTAKRGSGYYAGIAALRTTRKGGRPRKAEG